MPARSRRLLRTARSTSSPTLAKVATGIDGFDEITGGGLPEGRPTLVCGGPGCGKTLFALEFLVHGAARGESGVFVTFEETEEDILKNVSSLGYDVADLIKRKRLALEYIRVERSEIEETGEYDLEGLFIRLDHALRSIGARRIVLDTIESLFAGLSNTGGAARRVAPAVRLAEGARHHRRDHRRARRRHADASGPRGVRLGLRDPAGSPRHRPDLDAPAARRQVSRLEPRHQRISVPHRSARHRGPAGDLAAADPHGDLRARLDRHRLAGRDVRRAWATSGPAAS